MIPALCVALALLTTCAAQAGPWDAQLHLVSNATAEKYGARCLDGTLPGFYVRPGALGNKWKIHIQGGGWCTSLSDCYQRSTTLLGSTSFATPWLSQFWAPEHAGFFGLMDNNSTNPFGDWSFVWFIYCDGGSFTGNLATPLVWNNTSVYFRGAAVLDAILAELELTHAFLSQSTEVIVSGTSAGGLATYYHTAYIKSRLMDPAVRVVAMPDAGFFIDHATLSGKMAWQEALVAGATLWNATLRGAGTLCQA